MPAARRSHATLAGMVPQWPDQNLEENGVRQPQPERAAVHPSAERNNLTRALAMLIEHQLIPDERATSHVVDWASVEGHSVRALRACVLLRTASHPQCTAKDQEE
jgi:hypothetical protein